LDQESDVKNICIPVEGKALKLCLCNQQM
jgi:hypothetical protein